MQTPKDKPKDYFELYGLDKDTNLTEQKIQELINKKWESSLQEAPASKTSAGANNPFFDKQFAERAAEAVEHLYQSYKNEMQKINTTYNKAVSEYYRAQSGLLCLMDLNVACSELVEAIPAENEDLKESVDALKEKIQERAGFIDKTDLQPKRDAHKQAEEQKENSIKNLKQKFEHMPDNSYKRYETEQKTATIERARPVLQDKALREYYKEGGAFKYNKLTITKDELRESLPQKEATEHLIKVMKQIPVLPPEQIQKIVEIITDYMPYIRTLTQQERLNELSSSSQQLIDDMQKLLSEKYTDDIVQNTKETLKNRIQELAPAWYRIQEKGNI